MARYGKGQAGDDHVRQRVARYVDSLPERVGAEDDAVDVGLEHLSTILDRGIPSLWAKRAILALPSKGPAPRSRREHPVRREQDERFPMRLLEVKGDGPNGLLLERIRLAGRVGEVLRQMDSHLPRVVERTAERQRLGGIQTQPRLNKIEPGR